ncbi:Uma2 family endonuclease [Nocardioides hungaricus]
MTRAELDAWPDDGRRHELIDGVLIVTPVPPTRHQAALMGLFDVLHRSRPDGLIALLGPVDVVLADDTVMRPDLVVARRADFTERDLPGAPLLVVEVLSPSTRLVDLELKRARYEDAGCPSYWVFDPDRVELTVWELEGEGYREPVVVRGDATFRARAPYPVEVTPSRVAAG